MKKNNLEIENTEKEEQPQAKIRTTQEKLVPKFCTSISIALLKTNNVVLTMAYSEGSQESTALIERIVIDLEHLKSLHGAIEKIMEDSKKNV